MSIEDLSSVNVTYRRKQLYKCKSTESLNINSSLDTTDNDIHVKSLDLSTGLNNCYTDEINELKIQLQCTRDELDNIILENNQLKRIISRQNQQINTLKGICISPINTQKNKTVLSCKKRNRHVIQEHINNQSLVDENFLSDKVQNNIEDQKDLQSIKDVLIQERTEYLLNSQTESYQNLLTNSPSRSLRCCIKQPCETADNYSTKTPHKTRPPEYGKIELKSPLNIKQKVVYIIGGEQCRNLALKLSQSRRNSKYEKYKFLSFFKPGATTKEIIQTFKLYNFSENDRIILAVGEHDSNPLEVKIELSSALKVLPCPVFVLSVNNNKCLNEKKLNNMLKLTCKYFPNCRFIDLFNYNLQTKKLNMNNISANCQNINFAMDTFDYDQKYLCSRKNIYKWVNYPLYIHSSLHDSLAGISEKPKRGTIPYYFSTMKQRDNHDQFFRSQK